jgi:aminoglycoside 2''-phosphotransferase
LRRCCATYPEIETFWDRIQFYRGTFALLEALFGIENDDRRVFEAGIAQYV